MVKTCSWHEKLMDEVSTTLIKVNVKCLYLYSITLSASEAFLRKGLIRPSPHGSNVTIGRNRSTGRKPPVFGKVKLDRPLLTCDQGNFNQTTA